MTTSDPGITAIRNSRLNWHFSQYHCNRQKSPRLTRRPGATLVGCAISKFRRKF